MDVVEALSFCSPSDSAAMQCVQLVCALEVRHSQFSHVLCSTSCQDGRRCPSRLLIGSMASER